MVWQWFGILVVWVSGLGFGVYDFLDLHEVGGYFLW